MGTRIYIKNSLRRRLEGLLGKEKASAQFIELLPGFLFVEPDEWPNIQSFEVAGVEFVMSQCCDAHPVFVAEDIMDVPEMMNRIMPGVEHLELDPNLFWAGPAEG